MLSLGTAKTYLKIFSAIGIAGGTRAASKKLSYKITRSHPENEATQISVNGFDHPISLRLYTDDWSMMHQIFVDKDYKEPSPRHSEALEELYKRILSEGGRQSFLIAVPISVWHPSGIQHGFRWRELSP